jgi:hypothetical protein
MKQAEIMKEFNANDEKSVDFADDPDMYKKLNMKKPKKGEERPYDIEKIYEFQLYRDLAKINEVKGPFQERNERFLRLRHRDPIYHEIAKTPNAGSDGNFTDLLKYTAEDSWRLTSKPYGEIAHKRYLEYLANLPKGPTEEEIHDKEQRTRDRDLWKKVL